MKSSGKILPGNKMVNRLFLIVGTHLLFQQNIVAVTIAGADAEKVEQKLGLRHQFVIRNHYQILSFNRVQCGVPDVDIDNHACRMY